MFEALIERILLSRLGGFILDLDRNQLKVNIWTGKIVLENVRLDPKILLRLKLPLIFKYTQIAKIHITIPWAALNTKSVEISIEGVYCVMVPYEKQDWNFELGIFVDKVKESLKNHENLWEIEREEKKIAESQGKQSNSYLENLKNTILSNLKVNFSSIHLRFEDKFKRSEYSMGIFIESINSAPSSPESIVFSICDLLVYINVGEANYTSISEQIMTPSEKTSVLTLSTCITFTNSNDVRQIDANISDISFELTHLQYIYAILFIRKFSKYNLFLSKEIEKKKYMIYSPVERNAKNLWKFAKLAIFTIIRQKKNSQNIFVMPLKNTLYYKKKFKELFLKAKNEGISPEEEILYNKILFLCETKDLVLWEYEALGENLKKNKKTGGWFNFFGKKKEEEEPKCEGLPRMLAEKEKSQWKVIVNCHCELVSFNLATYGIDMVLAQSQNLRLSRVNLQAVLSERIKTIEITINLFEIIYKELYAEVTIFSVKGIQNHPGISFRSIVYTDIKVPNEIYFVSQESNFKISQASLSHLFNFLSIKDLSIGSRTKIIDRLKTMQEFAMNQITDVFYYEKTYKISLIIPVISVSLQIESGLYMLNLTNMHINDLTNLDDPVYTYLEIGCGISVYHNDYPIIPDFNLIFTVSTLAKKYLKLKWSRLKSDLDQFFDIKIKGVIEAVTLNLKVSLFSDLKQIQNQMKLTHSRESLMINKSSIIKNMEIMHSLTLNNGISIQKCVAVLKDDTVYFFLDSLAANAYDWFALTRSTVSLVESKTIRLASKGKVLLMEFKAAEVADKWFEKLSEKSILTSQVFESKTMEKSMLSFEFAVESSSILVLSSENLIEYCIEIDNQIFSVEYNNYVQIATIQCRKIRVNDKNDRNLLMYGGDGNSEKFILTHISESSQHFKGATLDISVSLSRLSIFCHQYALKDFIQSISTLPKSPKLSKDTAKFAFTIVCQYEFQNFVVIFSKNNNNTGQFAFEAFSGQIFYNSSQTSITGSLKKCEIFWLEKPVNVLIPLLSSDPNNPVCYNIVIHKNHIESSIRLPSINSLIVPSVVFHLSKYFSYLIPAQGSISSEPKYQKPLKNYLTIIIENFSLRTKPSYYSPESIESGISLVDFSIKDEVIKVIIVNLYAKSEHGRLSSNLTEVISSSGNVEIVMDDVSINFNYQDILLMIELLRFKLIEKGPQRFSDKKFDVDWRLSLVCKNFYVNLFTENEIIGFRIISARVNHFHHRTNQFLQIYADYANAAYNDEVFFDFLNESDKAQAIVEVSFNTLNQPYEVQVPTLKVLFHTKAFLMLEIFYYKVYNAMNAIKEERKHHMITLEKSSEYNINIKSAVFMMRCNEITTVFKQKLNILYAEFPFSICVKSSEFSITTHNKVVEDADYEFFILETPTLCYRIIFKTITLTVTLEDLQTLYQIYCEFSQYIVRSSILLKESITPNVKEEATELTQYNFNCSNIIVRIQTFSLNPLLELSLTPYNCEGLQIKSLEISAEIQLSIQYHNPLLSRLESFLEPVNLAVQISSNKNLKLSLNALHTTPLNLNITDSMIAHFSELYESKVSQNFPFTIFNNTGCNILIHSSEGLTKMILDGATEEFPIPNEHTVLSCEINENSSHMCAKIPIFSQNQNTHYMRDDIAIVSEIIIENRSKQLKISSLMEIKNETNMILDVVFYLGLECKDVYTVKNLPKDSVISVPLNCIKGCIAVVAENSELNSCNILNISSIKEEKIQCKSGKYFFYVSSTEGRIRIQPSFVIENYLPTYIIVGLSVRENIFILPGSSQQFFSHVNKAMKVSITVNGFAEYNNFDLFGKAAKTIKIQNGKVSTKIGCRSSKKNLYRIIFYPLVLLINKSLLPLDFYILQKDSFVNISENSVNARSFCFKDLAYCRVDNQLSNALSFNENLSKSFEILSNSGISYQLLYNVSNTLVPDSKEITKVVIFYSKIIITNFLAQDLRVAQHGTDLTNYSYIKTGDKNGFHWKTKTTEVVIVIKSGESSWSGPFCINKPCNLYIKSDIGIIKVEVKEEDSIIKAFFYDSLESDIRIENQTEFIISAYQWGCTLPEIISPCSSEYFTWRDHLEPKEIIIQFNYDGNLCEADLDLRKLNVSSKVYLKNSSSYIYSFIRKQTHTLIITLTVSPVDNIEESFLFDHYFLSFPHIMISIIQQEIYQKSEILLVSLTDVTAIFNVFSHHLLWNLDFKDLQIDSQIYKYVECPILLMSEGEDFMKLHGKISRYSNWVSLENIEVSIKNLIMNIDSNSLQSLLELYNRLSKVKVNDLREYLSDSESTEIAESRAYLFVSSIVIPKFTVNMSYRNLEKSSIKSLLMNCKNIVICFDKFDCRGFYGMPASLLAHISQTYRKMIEGNLDSILTQNGAIGGVMLIWLKMSKVISKSKNRKQYSKMVKAYKEKSTSRSTVCVSTNSSRFIVNNNREAAGVGSIIKVINNPISSFLNIFNSKKEKNNLKGDETYMYRQRLTRAFYGKLGLILPFQESDAIAAGFFREKEEKYIRYAYYGHVIGTDLSSNRNFMFVGFDKKFALLSLDESKVIWKANPIFTEPTHRVGKCIVFCGMNNKSKQFSFKVAFRESESMQNVENLVKTILHDLD